MLKRVLILGKANVGKSSLFNRLIKKKKALVINQPGVTRDILKHSTSWWNHSFEVWDSGGLWNLLDHKHHPTNTLTKLIDKKVSQTIKEVDILLLVMDAHTGCLDEDKKTFRLVKKSGKPFLTLVNKIDNWKKKDLFLSDFAPLGTPLLPCAFETNQGIPDIIEWIITQPQKGGTIASSHKASSSTPLLVAGKANVGKSSLCNALLKQERMLTSPVKGTTVDVVEEIFQYHKHPYTLMDTAGWEKTKYKKSKAPTASSLAVMKMQESLKKAQLLLLLIESTAGPSRQDARLLQLCLKHHIATFIVISKWDLMKDSSMSKKQYRQNLMQTFSFYPDLPVIFISTIKNQGLGVLLKKIHTMYQKLHFRVTTSKLNHFLMAMTRKAPAPVYGTQDVKFYYFTQTQQIPPTFIAFANYPEAVTPAYHRFLTRRIQKQWKLNGVPIRLLIQTRHKS